MNGRSLLIIDNERELVELLTLYFEGHGYAVDTAMDGHTGLAHALLHRPDVIICDLLMNRMHGFDVIEKLRARPELADTLIIVVTGLIDPARLERALALGADHYIVKPFRCEELLALVEARRAATPQ
jgi:DNA-binding response OmpR family regulator